jgi:hypothetical protein
MQYNLARTGLNMIYSKLPHPYHKARASSHFRSKPSNTSNEKKKSFSHLRLRKLIPDQNCVAFFRAFVGLTSGIARNQLIFACIL